MKTPTSKPFVLNSLDDIDFYKFAMGQLIQKDFPDVPVTFGFKNRTKSVRIGKSIPEADLRRELDHARTLRFNNTNLHYLRGTNEYSARMFKEPYLDFLRNFSLPPYELHHTGDDFELEFPGIWSEATYWETISLSIVNELYFWAELEKLSPAKRKQVFAEGEKRLMAKIEILKQNPGITFSEFGTRRRFSRDWQDFVVGTLASELPETQFRGTSNVNLAMKHGLLPMGTNAHELAMVLAGTMQRTDDELRNSQYEVLKHWWNMYGEGLSIVLPDTFGSDFVFRTMPREMAESWKGFRHDSGNPFHFGEKVIAFYKSLGIDPRKKLIVFSDGLDIEVILALYKQFKGRINVTFGWGTNLTNDLGFTTLSLVTKAITACGRPLVKLSDNLEKSTGPNAEKERYVTIFDYHNTFSSVPVY